MRIGFESKRAFTNFTGLGNYSRSTIELLSTFYPNNEYYLYTTPYKQRQILSFAERDNIKIRQPKGFFSFIPSLWRSFAVAKEAKQDKISIFHGLSGEMPIGLKKHGIKTAVTIHDLIFLRYPEFYKPIDRKIYKKKFTMSAQNADIVIAISEQTKQDCISLLGIDESKIRVVYQGCSAIFEKRCSDLEKEKVSQLYELPEKYFLYVGTIEERKNLITAIKALPQTPENYKLIVIGRPTPYITQVKEEIQKLALEDRVIFLQNIPTEHLPSIYQMAFAFIYPSLFEGFGIPIIEAINSKIPVITSSVSCLPEAGGPDSLYISPYDFNELASHLNKLILNENFRSDVIAKSYEYAQRFSKENVANNLWAVYKELSSSL